MPKKNRPFIWNATTTIAFDNLKKEFTSAPISMHVDLSNTSIIEVDDSDFVLGNILSQAQMMGNYIQLHFIRVISKL